MIEGDSSTNAINTLFTEKYGAEDRAPAVATP